MREILSIVGGRSISGTVRVSGAKNAALPLLMATLLTDELCTLENVPRLEDIGITLQMLERLGATVNYRGDRVQIQTRELRSTEPPHTLMKSLRASFWVLGPLLARGGRATVTLPGGDAIGRRPVDLHLQGLAAFGASLQFQHGLVIAEAPDGLQPASFTLEYPSVGATHQLLMTAALIPGETILEGVAQECEVVALAQFLSKMGAVIKGAGTQRIVVQGCSKLRGASDRVLGDRIEAATYAVAAAMCGGNVTIQGVDGAPLASTLELLREAGCDVTWSDRAIEVAGPSRLRPLHFETAPSPGIATDVQPLLLAAASVADGISRITETVFENRMGHVSDFRRFGAEIQVHGNTATIRGVPTLRGAVVHGRDIRAAAGLVLMGLVAEGTTIVRDIHHLDRGYESLVEKFTGLGAELRRLPYFEETEIVVGC